MVLIKKILVPIDFGPASDAAVEEAVMLASSLGAELAILHVYKVPVFAYPGAPYIAFEDISISLEKTARAGVDTVVHQISKRVPRVSGLIRHGSAWLLINDVAQEIGADLVVLGTHGRRGVPRMLLGSVAEKVVRTSPVPVLTVHAAEAAVRASRPERESDFRMVPRSSCAAPQGVRDTANRTSS